MVVKIAAGHRGNLAALAETEAIDGDNGVASLHGSEMDADQISTTVVLGQSTISSQANGVSAMDQSDDEHGGDASDESDSMDFDDDEDDDDDGSDLISNATLGDDITAQLAAAGPVGMAAAAAINSSKKRKRPHSFETNPSIRRRQQTRLLRKLRQTIDEYATRVGQQAIVLIATPGKPQNNFRVFGAKPLEDVVKNVKATVLQDLETALAHHAPPPAQDDPSLYELPPLVIDGIPTPVEKMTQAQLRAFIPLMLKFSTGRGKPGWGKESTRPPWWPDEVPWANVRMDARSEDDKQRVSWTHALRQIVINCYKYHGREDLLPAFSEEPSEEAPRPNKLVKTESESDKQGHGNEDVGANSQQASGTQSSSQPSQTNAQAAQQTHQHQQTVQQLLTSTSGSSGSQFTSTVVQTISNPDGTVSIIQVDPNNPIITLPDGTTAQVVAAQGMATFVPTSGITTVTSADGVATLTNSSDGQTVTTVDLTAVAESTIGQDGQHHILLTSEDGHTYPVSVSGMIAMPAMYQAVVANISQIQGQNDGSVQVLGPLITSLPKSDSNGMDDGSGSGSANSGVNVSGLSVTPVLTLGANGTQQHILQVTAAPMVTSQLLSDVDTSILASAMQQVTSGDPIDMHNASPSSNSE